MQGKSYPMDEIIEFRKYVKRNKVSLHFLSDYMGYSYTHISSVLNGKKKCTVPFSRLLYLALTHEARIDPSNLDKKREKLWMSFLEEIITLKNNTSKAKENS